jgi:3-dehydroquinate synthase
MPHAEDQANPVPRSMRIVTMPRVSDGKIVTLKVENHSYDITCRRSLLQQAGPSLRALTKSTKTALVHDTNLPRIHIDALSQSLASAGFSQPIECAVPPGEDHKTVDTLKKIYDTILPAGIDRATPIIALGGGVIGDTAGFAAATILRGVPFVQIPTTLLAMVDASLGGKTGVNHAVGKNLIGAFHQPIAVLIDPEVLTTLPPRELRSGLAECIKHDLIRDADGFALLERDIDRAIKLDLDYLTDLIAHNVAIKAGVVEADPLERGERAHLNFGHTFGHAIENISGYDYSHGECVALGMCAAAYASRALKLIDEPSRKRIIDVISSAGLPTGEMKQDAKMIVDAMAFDKKVKSGRLRFVLLDGIGNATIRNDVPIELVFEAVESLRG